MDSIPVVKPEVAEGVGGQFDGAIQKIQNAPKKAKKKIPPDTIPKLQESKTQSVNATRNAGQQTLTASNTVNSNPFAKMAMGGKSFDNMLGGGGPMGADGMGFGAVGAYSGPNISFSGGRGDYGGMNDISQLMGLFGQRRTEGGQISQGLAQVAGDQMKQLAQNQGFGQQIGQLTGLENQFGMQSNMLGMKEMMFKGISQSLSMVAKVIQMAARGLQAASQAVEAASQAVAAVPFVGPALSAALKAVAMMLKAIAQVLEKMGQFLEKTSGQMMQKSQEMGVQKAQMMAKKVATQAQRKVVENLLNQGKQRLDQIVGQRNTLAGFQQTNGNEMNAIARRLQELGQAPGGMGGPGAPGQGGPGQNPAAAMMMMGMMGGMAQNMMANA
ncbi:MAG: hypothetical protein EB084_21270, partial [Proteobacteria bacterium]|nr:hypothetical protein [Pseudomonadota bacterium]